MADETNGWTRWWWLRMDQMGAWSGDERLAFVTFVLTWVGISTLFASYGWSILLGLKVLGPTTSLLFSWFVSLSGCLFCTRVQTTQLFRDIVVNGDDAAATRLRGRVYLPTNNAWWFLDRRLRGTKAQLEARQRIGLIFIVILLLTFLPSVYLLMHFGASEGLALLIVLFTMLPSDLYAAHGIAIWPELVRQADKDAIAKENEINPPRT